MAALIYLTYALAAPGANTNILATSLQPIHIGSHFRVSVALTTSSVFNVITTDGTTAYTTSLNGATALAAASVYEFKIPAPKFKTIGGSTAMSYNFQVATDSVIRMLMVEEVRGSDST